MPVCVSYERLDELEKLLKEERVIYGKLRYLDLLAIIAELRRCRKVLKQLNQKINFWREM